MTRIEELEKEIELTKQLIELRKQLQDKTVNIFVMPYRPYGPPIAPWQPYVPYEPPFIYPTIT